MATAALLIPGPRLAALAWARGDIGDVEFIMDFPRVPEAALFCTLPDLASFRRCLSQFVSLYRSGAELVVFRSGTPAVCRHAAKWGAVWTIREPEDIGHKFRFLSPPEVTRRYFGRILQNSAAASGATTAR